MTSTLKLSHDKAYGPVVYGLALAAVAHSVFLVIFSSYQIQPLFLLNILSVILYLGLLGFVLRTKNILPAMVGGSVELIVHQAAIVHYLGWGYGFEYYLFVIPTFVLIGAFKNKLIPITFTVLSIIMLLALRLYSLEHVPAYAMEAIKETLALVNLVLTAVPIAIFSGIFAFNSYKNEASLLAAHKELYLAATYDPLTGLKNRAQGMKQLAELYTEHLKKSENYVLAIVDIDNFKLINDDYGHQKGDVVLKSVADTLRNTLRKDDYIFRWGGEEFLILLPNQDLTSGRRLLERLLEKSASEVILEQEKILVTMTIGAIESHKRPNEDLMRMADKALYIGKEAGKNCLVPVLQ